MTNTNTFFDISVLSRFLGLRIIVQFVYWKDVEEFEKHGWWIDQNQTGYCEDWEKGGVFMKRVIPKVLLYD